MNPQIIEKIIHSTLRKVINEAFGATQDIPGDVLNYILQNYRDMTSKNENERLITLQCDVLPRKCYILTDYTDEEMHGQQMQSTCKYRRGYILINHVYCQLLSDNELSDSLLHELVHIKQKYFRKQNMNAGDPQGRDIDNSMNRSAYCLMYYLSNHETEARLSATFQAFRQYLRSHMREVRVCELNENGYYDFIKQMIRATDEENRLMVIMNAYDYVRRIANQGDMERQMDMARMFMLSHGKKKREVRKLTPGQAKKLTQKMVWLYGEKIQSFQQKLFQLANQAIEEVS